MNSLIFYNKNNAPETSQTILANPKFESSFDKHLSKNALQELAKAAKPCFKGAVKKHLTNVFKPIQKNNGKQLNLTNYFKKFNIILFNFLFFC